MLNKAGEWVCRFQPFLRFYAIKMRQQAEAMLRFQPFLRFYCADAVRIFLEAGADPFQPFLRFYLFVASRLIFGIYDVFQPFLRFYRACVRFLWVFKFFFGFLSSRRSV